MKRAHLITTGSKFFALLAVGIIAIGLLWVAMGLPFPAVTSSMNVVKWALWIVAYGAAQLVVGVLVGRVIRGSHS